MLRSVDLPMPAASVQMLKAYVAGELCGCVGYERYGDAAVLHSLVVVREAKSEGVGRALVESLTQRLKQAGAREIFLATQDTTRYFGYLGFEPVPRAAIAAAVLASPNLSSYAEDEATFMRYRIE
jgi:arsenate reductase